jgi:uncharacterized protein YidB (DUF937 family)
MHGSPRFFSPTNLTILTQTMGEANLEDGLQQLRDEFTNGGQERCTLALWPLA